MGSMKLSSTAHSKVATMFLAFLMCASTKETINLLIQPGT